MSYQSKFGKAFAGLCFFLFASTAFGANVTTIYFVPFQIETYVPITQANVVSQAWEKWTISSDSQASGLIHLLTHGDVGEFNEYRVRVAIFFGNQTYFIDADGVVLVGEKSGIKIDKAAFIDFRDSLGIEQRKMLREALMK